MNNLLDTMFIKRFCLPLNVSIGDDGTTIKNCLCGPFNHVACVLKINIALNKSNVLSYGVNETKGIHAEHDAIRKLKPLKRNKKLVPIHLLVIRISGKNKLQSSKPCVNCIKVMHNLPKQLGYSIKHVYYSDDNGEIIKSNLSKLGKDEMPHLTTKLYKNKRVCK